MHVAEFFQYRCQVISSSFFIHIANDASLKFSLKIDDKCHQLTPALLNSKEEATTKNKKRINDRPTMQSLINDYQPQWQAHGWVAHAGDVSVVVRVERLRFWPELLRPLTAS
jgi:hypothetical protein